MAAAPRESSTCPPRRTKIVCTIGPASRDPAVIERLVEAGMDVARLNFSHGSHEEHNGVLGAIRRASERKKKPIAILQDLCGPKIRITRLRDGPIELAPGQRIAIEPGREVGDARTLGTTFEQLTTEVKPGHRILLDDGLIALRVRERDEARVVCEVEVGGTLSERKGMNLPDSALSVPAVTEKDMADLDWGLRNGVDYVALSFVRRGSDLDPVRERIRAAGRSDEVRVVAKIERPEAVEHLVEVVEASDAIMVARGDLGVEMPVHQVPSIQKRIIRECILRDRPVITATQMLDSMTRNPRPTRAEVSDVANAIYDGTDAVMLSGETAVGDYPVQTVETMAEIALEADRQLAQRDMARLFESRIDTTSFADSICDGAWRIARHVGAAALVTFTATGRSALFMSKYFPPIPIIGVTFHHTALRRMMLFRGVTPLRVGRYDDLGELLRATEMELLGRGLVKKGDVITCVGGTQLTAGEAYTNLIKIRRV